MKNYVQEDDVVVVTAPYDVNSGDGLLVGSLFGVAITDAKAGALVPVQTEDVIDLTKATGESWTEGEEIYFHNGTTKYCTATSGGNTKVGVAVLRADGTMPGTTDAAGRVRLNGSF